MPVLLLDLGSFTLRAATATKSVSFPAALVRRTDSTLDAAENATAPASKRKRSGRAAAEGGDGSSSDDDEDGPSDDRYLVGPDVLEAAATARVRRACSAPNGGFLFDTEAAQLLVERALIELQITNEKDHHAVVACPRDSPSECMSLWSELLFGRFRFRAVSLISSAAIAILATADASQQHEERAGKGHARSEEESMHAAAAAAGHGLSVEVGHSRMCVTPFVAFRPVHEHSRTLHLGGHHVTRFIEGHLQLTQLRVDGGAELLCSELKHTCTQVWPRGPVEPLLQSREFARLVELQKLAAQRARRGRSVGEVLASAMVERPEGGAPPILCKPAVLPEVFILPSADFGTLPGGQRLPPPSSVADSAVDGWGALVEELVDQPGAGPRAVVLFHETLVFGEAVFAPELCGTVASPLVAGTLVAAQWQAMEKAGLLKLPQIPGKSVVTRIPATGLPVLIRAACNHETGLPGFVRNAILSNVTVSGGVSSAEGFAERMRLELAASMASDEVKPHMTVVGTTSVANVDAFASVAALVSRADEQLRSVVKGRTGTSTGAGKPLKRRQVDGAQGEAARREDTEKPLMCVDDAVAYVLSAACTVSRDEYAPTTGALAGDERLPTTALTAIAVRLDAARDRML